MQVRPVSKQPRPAYRFLWRLTCAVVRWSFIVLGAVVTASVLFTHIYRVNETIYDPSSFAIGVAGLFAMLCGVMEPAGSAGRSDRAPRQRGPHYLRQRCVLRARGTVA
jgi:hypothetical protein